MAPLALISSIVASTAAKGTPGKKWVLVKYTLSTAAFSSDLLRATTIGISVFYGLAKSVEVSVVSEIGSTPEEVEPEAAADIVDDEEKAFGLGEGVVGFDKFTCGKFLVPEGIMPVRGEDNGSDAATMLINYLL
jgi:hypothetical protein